MGSGITNTKLAVLAVAVVPLAMVLTGCVPAALSVNDSAFRGAADSADVVDPIAEKDAAANAHPRTGGDRIETVQTVSKRSPETNQPRTSFFAKGKRTMSIAERKNHSSGKVEYTSTSSFQQDVLDAELPVLVDFYADWCGPCRRLGPTLDKLARETTDAKVVKVDIDKNPQLAAKYRVSSIPTVMVFKDGNVVAQHTGLADQKTLEQLLGS
jgi:thioredoxin 1